MAKKEDALKVALISKRMKRAEVFPWKKRRGSYGWAVIEPKGFGGCDILIASNLNGDTADFLCNVPDDIRYLLSRITELEWKLSQKRKRK